ncbi:GTP-binding protein [Methylorubrum suomiense]
MRSTPEYMLAYVALLLLGPSMLPAILALSIHNAGIVGFLLGRHADDLAYRPDAPRGLNLYAYETVPRLYGQFLAYLLYRWEIILRESAILGMLGVATLGFYIDAAISELRLDVAVVLIAATALMTMAIDALSRALRRSLRIADLPTRLSRPLGPSGEPEMSAPIILATAGHIDHGKTSLVKALTGIDADRLPEEKARGITLDLGFAYRHDEGSRNGTTLGFVDVPGHERLVRTMVAGATGVDGALLVVAADDGVMPQTREHLSILDLLGIGRGVVAITKSDRVDATRLAAVTAEVRSSWPERRWRTRRSCPARPGPAPASRRSRHISSRPSGRRRKGAAARLPTRRGPPLHGAGRRARGHRRRACRDGGGGRPAPALAGRPGGAGARDPGAGPGRRAGRGGGAMRPQHRRSPSLP